MMEDDEMIYTAIFQDRAGRITKARYTGAVSRKHAWADAVALGEPEQVCLIALVPGDHPVHTYDGVFGKEPNTELQRHDVYEVSMEPEDSAYEIT